MLSLFISQLYATRQVAKMAENKTNDDFEPPELSLALPTRNEMDIRREVLRVTKCCLPPNMAARPAALARKAEIAAASFPGIEFF